jgi:1-phosphatidylinositol-3-phosphate 5-kinase
VDFLETHEGIGLVGGTFSLSKALSADEHASLVRVLRVSTYTLLSLLLEQHFLSSSSIELHYPKVAPPPISIPPPTVTLSHRNSSPDVQVEVRQRKRDILRQGIWSLFHKRLQRSVTVNTSESRGVSLDLPRPESDVPRTPRTSLEVSPTSPLRQRRFSIFGGETHAPPPSPTPPPETSLDRAFQSALHRIEESKVMLSASPGLVISPPRLLVQLAESEKEHPGRRLTGEERTALTSILGWEGKKAAGRGNLISTAAFLRQQQLSLLYSEHIYCSDRMSQTSADGTLNRPVEGESKKQSVYVHCGTPVRWLTYVYYASGNHDRSLGDMITSICMQANEPCSQPGCKSPRRQHEQRWIHGGVRVVAQTEVRDPSASPSVLLEDIEMWQSCKICRKSTTQCKMSDGT